MFVAPNRHVARLPGVRREALLLDAMGTLVHLEDPVRALSDALAASGFANDDGVVAQALRNEIAFYRANHLRGGNAAGLAALRRDCARVLAGALDAAPAIDELTTILVGALRFRAFDDAAPLLAACRARGIRTAVVSDWDCALAGHLAGIGLASGIDTVVCSAEVGVTKPDPQIFGVALDRLGVAPEAALHVGDDPRRDLGGAVAAGIAGVLLDRDDRHPGIMPRVASLADVVALL